jgi:hypothetical protein
MRAHPIGQPMIHWADVQIDGLEAAECPLDIPFVMPLII